MFSNLLCIANPHAIKLSGNMLEDFVGNALAITLNRCQGDDYCANESEIDSYINSHWGYYFMSSQVYKQNVYTSNVVESSKSSDGYRLDSSNPKEIYFSIQENIVDSE